ncbi:MAG: Uma2 family endonuclease [Sphingomonadaceae bacterium]|nr:Uma2 family endonuclease [Sphingomonadaceae bacterium]
MTEQRPLNTAPLPLKLRVEDYLALDEIGAFADYAKTELIEGEIVFVNAQHRPHARLKMKLYDALRDALLQLGPDMVALVEASVAMPDHSVPEPDIVLTREPDGEGLIPLSSVTLIVEVSDTSLRMDLGRKAKLYARKGVPEYWVADVNARVIHQLWSPQGGVYAEGQELTFGQMLPARTIEALRIETDKF